MGRGRGRCQRSATYCDCRYHKNFRSQVQREINDDRASSSSSNPRTSSDFGNGEVGGDNRWTAPVYGATSDGREVTASFGQGGRDGHTLVSDGHVSGAEFYNDESPGHDHYGSSGESHRDSGRYRG